MAQVKGITSESLESAYRNLTPSQQGFTEDLQASNVILPIIDLTASAEGSSVREDLQTAIAYGSQTSFNVTNTTTNLANTGGFWRIIGSAYSTSSQASSNRSGFAITDGLSSKDVVKYRLDGGLNGPVVVPFDFIVFLRSGDTLTATTQSTNSSVVGSYRQIADENGTLVNPSGFTPQ
tara:strand:+ start:1346 stop:1879 length:534 start_codon:yes stop_codon:yes gene_type:complete